MLKSKLNLALAAALLFTFAAPAFAKDSQAGKQNQETVAKLVAVLKSDAAQKEKADACRELARIGTRDAVAPLAALLADERLSHMARYGLETIPDPAVDQAFRDALGKLNGRPLVGVIGSIGVRRDAKAVQPLSKLLHDYNPEVAQAAARTLGRIATPAAAAALQDALRDVPEANQPAFCEGLFRCADAFAANGKRKQAAAIYDRLRGLQAPHQVRTAALRGAIVTRSTKDGLPLLLKAFRGEDYSQCAAAARISQEMPGPEVTRALAAEISNCGADKQVLLVQTLANRGDATALPALTAAARNGEKTVRLAAIRALPQFGKSSVSPTLVELMGDSDRDLARAAQDGLAGLPGQEVDAAVLGMLQSSDSGRKLTGMDLIVRRRMTSATPALLKEAQSADVQVRTGAIRKLGELAPASELPAVLDLLTKAQPGQDLEAAEQALGAVCVKASNRETCAETLGQRLSQAAVPQKCALLRVLATVGGHNALESVRGAIKESDTEVRSAAVRALGSWTSAEAAPELLQLAKKPENPTERMLCLRSYLGWAGHADLDDEQRLNMCRQASPLIQKDDEKKLYLAALGSINSTDAITLILPYVRDEATREEAANACVSLADKLLKGQNASRLAARLVEPLEQVARTTGNADLAKRAKSLADQAKSKSAR